MAEESDWCGRRTSKANIGVLRALPEQFSNMPEVRDTGEDAYDTLG
jgi:hypothetical protein